MWLATDRSAEFNIPYFFFQFPNQKLRYSIPNPEVYKRHKGAATHDPGRTLRT